MWCTGPGWPAKWLGSGPWELLKVSSNPNVVVHVSHTSHIRRQVLGQSLVSLMADLPAEGHVALVVHVYRDVPRFELRLSGEHRRHIVPDSLGGGLVVARAFRPVLWVELGSRGEVLRGIAVQPLGARGPEGLLPLFFSWAPSDVGPLDVLNCLMRAPLI